MLNQERIVALDIGASGLKMAVFVPLRSGGIELVQYAVGALDLDPQSDTDRGTYITTTIRELMRESSIKPGPVLLSVSGQSVFSRFVKLPPVDREKVYQIILYEAQQNVPFPMEEVVWDYQLIGGAGGELDVMLAAIKSDIIRDVTDAVESSGLNTDLVDVAPMALYNAVRYNYPDLPQCTLVVDIGARSTDLIFIEQGRVFSRSVPVAGNAITQQIMHEFELTFPDAEEMKKAHAYVAFGGAYAGPKSEVVDKVSKSVRGVMTRMHAEINRSINFYRSQQSGRQPDLVLLTGGTSVIPYTDTFLKEKLRVDVDYMNPFLNVAVADKIPAEEIGRNAHLLGQVVGLALRKVLTCPIELNLLPPQVVARKAFRKKQSVLVGAAVGLILTMIVWCGYFYKMTGLAEQRLEAVRGHLGALQAVEVQLQQNEQKIQETQGKVQKVVGLVSRRTQWLEALNQIRESIPDGMWLTAVKPVSDPSIVPAQEGQPPPPPDAVTAIEVTGLGYRDKMTSGSAILGFRDKLRMSPLFAKETEVKWQPSPGAEDNVLEFKILVVLKNPLIQ